MVIEGYTQVPIDEFGGGNQRGERSDVKPDFAIEASNVEFEPGYVRTRRGFYASTNSNLKDNYPVAGSLGMTYAGKSYFLRTLRNPATSLTTTVTQYDGTAGATGLNSYSSATPGYGSYAEFGKRVYICHGNAGMTAGQLGAVDVTTGSAVGVWMPPATSADIAGTSFTLHGTGTGLVTTGTHQFRLLMQSKSGFITRTAPVGTVASGILGVVGAAGAAVNDKIDISITAPGGGWNANLASVTLLATTATNLGQYYIVPGTTFTLATTGDTLTFTFNIADVDLAQQIQADPYEDVVYSGLTSAGGLVTPYYCFVAGRRMGIFFEDSLGPALAFSELDSYETFTLSRNVVRLPSMRRAIAGRAVQRTIYIFAEDSTYAFNDTGGAPVTWPTAATIDSKIGTLCPTGITLDSAGNGAVAHTTGLYIFSGGQYNQAPVSYWQPDTWNSISWSDQTLSLVDDKENFRLVMGFKDLSGNRHIVSWNYVRGYGPDDVKFSEYFFGGAPTGYFPVWAAIVTNYGDSRSGRYRKQLWLQQGTFGQWIMCRDAIDANPYRDTWYNGSVTTTTGIYTQRYRMAYLPARPRTIQLNQHGFGLMRITGSGNFRYNVYGLDDTIVAHVGVNGTPSDIALSDSPAKEIMVAYQLISEMASIEIVNSSTSADTHFEMSHWSHYYKLYSQRRGS